MTMFEFIVMATNKALLTLPGPSSNIAFLGHVSKAIEATQDPAYAGRQPRVESDAAILQGSRPSRHVSPRMASEPDVLDPFQMPLETELIDLAQQFFSNTVSYSSIFPEHGCTARRNSCSEVQSGVLRFRPPGCHAIGNSIELIIG